MGLILLVGESWAATAASGASEGVEILAREVGDWKAEPLEETRPKIATSIQGDDVVVAVTLTRKCTRTTVTRQQRTREEVIDTSAPGTLLMASGGVLFLTGALTCAVNVPVGIVIGAIGAGTYVAGFITTRVKSKRLIVEDPETIVEEENRGCDGTLPVFGVPVRVLVGGRLVASGVSSQDGTFRVPRDAFRVGDGADVPIVARVGWGPEEIEHTFEDGTAGTIVTRRPDASPDRQRR